MESNQAEQALLWSHVDAVGAPTVDRAVRRLGEPLVAGRAVNGRYDVVSEIGHGGMGRVYRVEDRLFRDRRVAMKTIRGATLTADQLSLFKAEFKVMAALRHPHVANVYDFEPLHDGDGYLFTMEWIDGEDIAAASRTRGWPEIVGLLVQVLRALAYLHSRTIVHGDIKPQNVMVDSAGQVKVLDFGLTAAMRGVQGVLGTPAYLAPELVHTATAEHQADLYSLGAMAYELLTGRAPFTASSLTELLRRHASDPLVFDDAASRELPAWLRAIVARLCAKTPGGRFATANAVIGAINREGGLGYELETDETRRSYLLSSQLVGRNDELERVLDFVNTRTREPTTPVALFIGGSSGVGKSRLMREVRHHIQLSLTSFLEADCHADGSSEYRPFIDLLRQLARLADATDSLDVMSRAGPALARIAPDLLAELGLSVTPADNMTRALEQLAELIVEVATRTPLAIYLNDLHWARAGTVDLLGRLLRHTRNAPSARLVLLGSYRSDELDGRPVARLLGNPSAVTSWDLAPLDETNSLALMHAMLGPDALPEQLGAQLAAASTGNPFFIEELTRALVERGAIGVSEDRWVVLDAPSAQALPASIAAVFLERVARLSALERRVMDVIAVHGRPIAAPLVASSVGVDVDQVHEVLGALVLRRMIRRIASDEMRYEIAHSQMRAALYQALADRAAVHERLGNALEGMRQGYQGELYMLAYHFVRTSQRDKALTYSLAAGEQASAVHQSALALELLDGALALMSTDDPRRLSLQETVAELLRVAGRFSQAAELFRATRAETSELTAHGRVLRKEARTLHEAGRTGEAVELLWEFLTRLGEPAMGRTRAGRMVVTLSHAVAALIQRRLPQRDLAPAARDRISEAWHSYTTLFTLYPGNLEQGLLSIRIDAKARALGLSGVANDTELAHAPARVRRLEPDIYHVKLTVSATYLLEAEGVVTVVNAGRVQDLPLILTALRQRGYRPSDVDRIVVTGTYSDNLGGVAALRSATGALVCAHGMAIDDLHHGRVNHGRGARFSPGPAGVAGRLMSFANIWRPEHSDPMPVDRELSDGEMLPCGATIVHLPGSMPGAIGVFWRRTLMVTHTIFPTTTMRGYMPGYDDPEAASQSIRRIMALEFDNFVCSYAPPVVGDAKRRLAELPAVKRALGRGR